MYYNTITSREIVFFFFFYVYTVGLYVSLSFFFFSLTAIDTITMCKIHEFELFIYNGRSYYITAPSTVGFKRYFWSAHILNLFEFVRKEQKKNYFKNRTQIQELWLQIKHIIPLPSKYVLQTPVWQIKYLVNVTYIICLFSIIYRFQKKKKKYQK